jgi:hypothetical protein
MKNMELKNSGKKRDEAYLIMKRHAERLERVVETQEMLIESLRRVIIADAKVQWIKGGAK